MSNNLDNLASDVFLFNEISGNFKSIDYDKLLAQAKVVLEEALELKQAVEDCEGDEQVLKETTDVLVTIFGMFGMLENAGFDVQGAWNAVNKNNLTKFCISHSEALNCVLDYSVQGVKVVYDRFTSPDGSVKYVLKDENGKVRKPTLYKKVSVKQFLPTVTPPR